MSSARSNVTVTPADRATLIARRRTEYPAAHPNAPDFSYSDGRCRYCGADLVEEWGESYPTVMLTSCGKCHRSYCE